MKMKLSMAVGSLILVLAGAAEARTWGPGRHFGPGAGPGGGGGPWFKGPHKMFMRHHCGGMVLHAPADILKEELGLSDDQLNKLRPVRRNFEQKQIQLWAEMKQQELRMRDLMEQDLPEQKKVLDTMRKMRRTGGVAAEEAVKAQLNILGLMTQEQRTTLKKHCRQRGLRGGWDRWKRKGKSGKGGGRGHHGKWGSGQGWGGGPPSRGEGGND